MAQELKDRENPQMLGAILGIVMAPPPQLKISILNGTVMITDCYVLQNLLQGYRRMVTVAEQTATGTGNGKGIAHTVIDGGMGASPHQHDVTTNVTIQTVGLPNVTLDFEDTLKVGDEVLLVVSPNNQTYFVIGKVQKMGDRP